MSKEKKYVLVCGFLVGLVLAAVIWTAPEEPEIPPLAQDEDFIRWLSNYD